jgi:DNA-directed RNA polymerase beta subunit
MSDQTGITPEGAFQTLKDNTVEAINAYFPFEGKNKKLIVEGVHVDDKLESDDIAAQTAVKDKDGTWGVPIKANLKLINKHTGEVLDEKKGAILGRLPKLTNRYSYIVNGNEYQVDHLFRLRSGVYARVQNNGELESEFNLEPDRKELLAAPRSCNEEDVDAVRRCQDRPVPADEDSRRVG